MGTARNRSLAAACAGVLTLASARAAAQDPGVAAAPPGAAEVPLAEPRLVPVDAPPRRSPRLHLAAAVGYAAPWGESTADDRDDFTRVLSFAVPLRLEATWALGREHVGLFVVYGLAGAGSFAPSCEGEFECSARDLRVGLVARHAFAPAARLSPSVALVFGWESARLEVERPAGRLLHGRRGLFGGLEAAAERRVWDTFRAGPYLAVLVGQFGRARIVDADATGRWEDVRSRALHGWAELGLRASYGL
jgi:hypothetical protein